MIPEGWNSQKLEEVCINIVDCHHSTPVWTNDGFIVLRTQNIRDGVIDFSSISFTDELHYYERIKRAVPEEGDIVVTREAPAGEVALIPADMKVCLGQRLVLIKVNHKLVSSPYVKFYLMSSLVQRNVFQLQSNGSTVGNIRIPVLKSINLLLPPLPEQCKIAEILSIWDKAIALLEQLITAKRKLKQGLMQQLLTGKKRFKEFEGSDWKTYHFKEIFKRVTRKNTIGNSNILTISGNHGLINQRDFFNKRIAADNLDGYYLIKKGEFAYNKSYSNGYPLGAIKRLDRYEKGVLSTLYICFKIFSSSVNSDFLAHYFEAGIINKQIYAIAQEGARNHGLLNISVTDFFEILLRLPSLAEQQKIASILSTADAEISTLEKQLAAYKQQKRGLMQQLLTGKKRVKIDEPQMQKV